MLHNPQIFMRECPPELWLTAVAYLALEIPLFSRCDPVKKPVNLLGANFLPAKP
jgi:hypothetical protein